uniref:Uncharacterized protein n=1 Tax=Picea glauca TaxID=3330 RepID=A0A101LZT8_PICGL|nr:hypothetical protein ABT39_MTgene5404 [Picea glauca]QHR86027.1 hypothetical protein Q903MT_gene25 [Picea sitchensis]
MDLDLESKKLDLDHKGLDLWLVLEMALGPDKQLDLYDLNHDL